MGKSFETELQFLCRCLARRDAVLALPEAFDWQEFDQLVACHRVAALVNRALSEAGLIDHALPEVARELARAGQANAQAHLAAIGNTLHLTRALGKAGIACATLKGVAVAEGFYEYPGDREMIDIDLLVDPAGLQQAEDIVTGLGYQRIHPRFTLTQETRASFLAFHNAFTYFRKSDGAQLDLHWRMMKNPALSHGLDRLWPEWIDQMPAAGAKIPVPGLPLHALYIIVHGAKSGWVRLKWLVDLDRVLRGLDDPTCDAMLDLAEELSMQRLVATSIALSRDLLSTSCSGRLGTFVSEHCDHRMLALQRALVSGPIRSKGGPSPGPAQLLRRLRHSLSLYRGQGYRRGVILREAGRPEDLENVKLPPGLLWTLPLLSPVLAAKRALVG